MYAFPRGSPRSESEWVYLKYCYASAWLLSNFPDFSTRSRLFVNVYWFTTYAGIFFVFFLRLCLSRAALVCNLSLVLKCSVSCTIPLLSTMLELWQGFGLLLQHQTLPSLTVVHFGSSSLLVGLFSRSWL